MGLKQNEWAEYKYVVVGGEAGPRWETGPNRVLATAARKELVLEDVWEHYWVHFCVNHKVREDQVMRINGSAKSLGLWN